MERELVSAIHHPTALKPMCWLDCSCGYSGSVAVDVEQLKDQVEEKAKCPNCGSPTVHFDDVTEKATTVHQFSNGDQETVVAKDPEVKFNGSSVAIPTVDDVAQLVLKKLSPTFDRLNAFLDAQSKPAPAAPAAPAATAAPAKKEGE